MRRDASTQNHYANQNPPRLIVPSSWHLEQQIAAAMAKSVAAVERATLAQEARPDVLIARGLARAARGRIYDAIQRGHG